MTQWWEAFPDLTKFMLEGPTELPFPIYSKECHMEPGEFVMERFTKAVTALMDSVREMIGASKLLRARVEGNDQVLFRVEKLMRDATDQLGLMDQRLTKIENSGRLIPGHADIPPGLIQWLDAQDRRITAIEETQGTYPNAIP